MWSSITISKRRFKFHPFISCFVCFGGLGFRSWHFDDFGRVLGWILVLSEIGFREICRCLSRPFLFAFPFCCVSFCLYSGEDLGGGAVSPVTLDLYVALLVPLGPVVWRICWRFLERCRCFLRVLDWVVVAFSSSVWWRLRRRMDSLGLESG